MTHLYIDIETVPAQRPDVMNEISAGREAALASAIASIRPSGNYKKQETIDEWMANEAPKAIEALRSACAAEIDDAYRKTSFDGAYGQICVIGFAVDDTPATTLQVADLSHAEERSLLEAFSCSLTDLIPSNEVFSTCVIGHNVALFDLRFLAQRHVVYGIRPHLVLARAAQAKPWESDKVFDTMVQWAGVGNRVKLDKLCKALSVATPKGAIDGSKVWDFVQAGHIQQVADYCAGDVEATRAIYRRMTFQPELQAA